LTKDQEVLKALDLKMMVLKECSLIQEDSNLDSISAVHHQEVSDQDSIREGRHLVIWVVDFLSDLNFNRESSLPRKKRLFSLLMIKKIRWKMFVSPFLL